MKSTFTTLDVYLAGYLTLKGFTPHLIPSRQGSKVLVSFDAKDELFQAMDEYNSGSQVEALRLALTIKRLKSQIFTIRNNGYEEKDRKDEEQREAPEGLFHRHAQDSIP